MTCVDEKLHGLKLAFKLLCSLSEFMFACFDWLNSENTEWEFFALFDLWSETRLIKCEGIEAPAERHHSFTMLNQRFHRADSRISLQWCQEITVHECAKIAKY